MNDADLIRTTKELVRIPSTANNPAALSQAVEFVANILADVPHITIERFERNGKPSFLAYAGTQRPEKFDILLNAHIDVVPARPEQFEPYEKDGKLYGRGVLDMKGTTVVLVDIFRELVNKVPHALGLQVVSDEEVGGYDGVQYQIEQHGVRTNFAIMGEYSDEPGTIYNAARGLCWAEILFKGKTAHGGHLWHGDNAIIKASEFATAVLRHYPTPNKPLWTTTASIASLSTPNETYNKVPDSAVLKVDFRFTQENPVFHDQSSLQAFIASIDPDAELINTAVFEPAVYVDKANPYVQGLDAAYRKVTSHEPNYGWRPGGSDGRHLALVGNDSLEFGLYGSGSHSDNECVELAAFAEYRAIMRDFLLHPIPTELKQADITTDSLQQSLLRKLVAMPTVSGEIAINNRALHFVEAFLTQRGMYVTQFESNDIRSLIATTKPGDKQPTVLLSAHIDVVPASPEQFVLTAKGDELHGRGALDMKAAIASYMWLVDKLQDDLDSYDFGIMITSDEEVGSANGMKLLVEREGYRPKVVVAPDSGENWQFEHFAKGVQWIKLETTGTAAHASRPWEGDSAIHRLLGALQEIKKLSPHDPQPNDTFISVGTITGGVTANQIPTSASAMLDIRYGTITDFKQLYLHIEAICKEHGVRSTIKASEPPVVNDMNNPYIKPFRDAVTRVTGKEYATSVSYGVTDGRFFSAFNIPCVVVTPPGGGRHKDDEWISSQGFDQFCEALKQYMQEVAVVSQKDTSVVLEGLTLE